MCINCITLHVFISALYLFFSEGDKSNDEKSLERLLDRQLTLIVKQKLGKEDTWCLPMGAHSDGESMRQVKGSSQNGA